MNAQNSYSGFAPTVLCPVCGQEVELSRETWHNNCGDPGIEEDFRTAMANKAYDVEQQRNNTIVTWNQSKTGGTHAFIGMYVLIVKRQQSGKWSCGAYISGDDGELAFGWKNNFPSEKRAQANISKRVTSVLNASIRMRLD